MLSALIPSERRYSALRLTPQPIHGRFVPSGPLVSLLPYFYGPRLYLHPIADLRLTNHSLALSMGVGVLFSDAKSENPALSSKVVTGTNSKYS